VLDGVFDQGLEQQAGHARCERIRRNVPSNAQALAEASCSISTYPFTKSSSSARVTSCAPDECRALRNSSESRNRICSASRGILVYELGDRVEGVE